MIIQSYPASQRRYQYDIWLITFCSGVFPARICSSKSPSFCSSQCLYDIIPLAAKSSSCFLITFRMKFLPDTAVPVDCAMFAPPVVVFFVVVVVVVVAFGTTVVKAGLVAMVTGGGPPFLAVSLSASHCSYDLSWNSCCRFLWEQLRKSMTAFWFKKDISTHTHHKLRSDSCNDNNCSLFVCWQGQGLVFKLWARLKLALPKLKTEIYDWAYYTKSWLKNRTQALP